MVALEGASVDALEETVKPFPSLQIDPYRNLAPHFGVASARAAALHAIATGTARVVVASASALLPRLSPAGNLEAAAIELKPGMDLDPVALGDLLADAGFTREDPVDEHGEFCVRGGIVDWFPAGADHPIRVEFVGDNVESIRRYDPSTQRSIETIDQASVIPLTEKSGSATFFDYLPDDRGLTFIVREEDEVAAHAATLRRAGTSRATVTRRRRIRRHLAPDDLFVPWEEVAARLANATRLEELAIEGGSKEQDPAYDSTDPRTPRALRTTSPASRPSSSAAESRSGSRRSNGCASAATPCCLSPPPRGEPSARPSCWRSTDSGAC